MVDTTHSKCVEATRAGSSPASGIAKKVQIKFYFTILFCYNRITPG